MFVSVYGECATLGGGICAAKTNTCEIIDQVGQIVYCASSGLANLSIGIKNDN